MIIQFILFQDFLDHYLEIYIRPNVSYRTYVRYKPAIEYQIKPYFKDRKLTDIKERDISDFYVLLKEKNYSPYTINTNAIILKGALEIANKEGLISYNPCNMVKRPKLSINTKRPISKENFDSLIQEMEKDDLYGNFFCFIAYSGLRRGEALGLSLSDINFKEETIFIHQQITMRDSNKGATITKNTKTNSSRLIHPPKEAFLYLQRQIQMIKRYTTESHSKSYCNPNRLIFVNKFGHCLFNPELCRHFKKIKEKVGLTNITIHTLRSIAATRLAEETKSLKKASRLLGHEKFSNTSDFYLPITKIMEQDLADDIDRIFKEFFYDN